MRINSDILVREFIRCLLNLRDRDKLPGRYFNSTHEAMIFEIISMRINTNCNRYFAEFQRTSKIIQRNVDREKSILSIQIQGKNWLKKRHRVMYHIEGLTV